ncbi:hypothetical protein AB6813_07125 [bacterium RCC_150]
MAGDDRTRSVPRRILWITVGILIGVVAGLVLGWQIAPAFVLIYFCVGWAAKQGQKQKREIDIYREQWLNKRRMRNDGMQSPPE